MIVAVGDRVSRGQQIGEIGNSSGRTAAYLNFDISTTTILEEDPADYPRLDLNYLLENYVDPLEFIRNNRPIRNMACMPTPYDGKTLIWHWRGSSVDEETIDELARNIRRLAPNVSGIIVKVADGENWQGMFSSGDMAINGVDDIVRWVTILESYGLELHVWAVPHGLDIIAETTLLATVANIDGVQSLILDVEPYAGYWQGGEAAIAPFMTSLRDQLTNPNFHIGLMIDPRPHQYDAIFADEWRPYVNSVHPLIYWDMFRQIPEDTLQVAWETWGDYDLPLIPVMQGDTTLSDQQAVVNKIADEQWNIRGISWWQIGNITDYDVVNQLPTVTCAS
jgi:hypothetical protein